MLYISQAIRRMLPESTSHVDGAHINSVLMKCHKYHQRLTAIYLPLVVTCMIFSCFWGYIQGASQKYTDPSSQWQACLVVPNNAEIPLSQILTIAFEQIEAVLGKAIGTAFECPYTLPECADSQPCVGNITQTCFVPLVQAAQALSPPEIDNISMPVGQMLEGLGYIGFQAVIFSLVAHGSLNRALRHPSWLPATIALMVWCIFAILTYYTVNPVIPIPAKTNATTLIFMMYSKMHIFNDINDGDNNCDKAFRYLWVYLGIILAIVANVFLSLLICIRAEWARMHAPNRKTFQPLHNTMPPVILCVIMVIFYIMVCFSKLSSSVVILNAIHSYDQSREEAVLKGDKLWFDDYFFPFLKGTLDISSLLFVAAFMAVIRGYSRQSVSAFRLAAGMAFAYSLTAYPGVTGAFRFYTYNDFQDDQKCKDFFLDPETTGTFGYPSEHQAKMYCDSFRVSIAAACGMVFTMHLMMVAAGMAYNDNQHRASAIFEPLDPSVNVVRNSLIQATEDESRSSKLDQLERDEDF